MLFAKSSEPSWRPAGGTHSLRSVASATRELREPTDYFCDTNFQEKEDRREGEKEGTYCPRRGENLLINEIKIFIHHCNSHNPPSVHFEWRGARSAPPPEGAAPQSSRPEALPEIPRSGPQDAPKWPPRFFRLRNRILCECLLSDLRRHWATARPRQVTLHNFRQVTLHTFRQVTLHTFTTRWEAVPGRPCKSVKHDHRFRALPVLFRPPSAAISLSTPEHYMFLLT